MYGYGHERNNRSVDALIVADRSIRNVSACIAAATSVTPYQDDDGHSDKGEHKGLTVPWRLAPEGGFPALGVPA